MPDLKPVIPDDETPLDPWDRQPGEPSKSFAVFVVYRDMGARRSLRAACKSFYGGEYAANKLRNAQEWSRHWDWVKRVAAWDNFLDREARISQIEAVREMNRRYANTARAMLSKALLGIKHLDPDELEATDIARLAELANKIERLCFGEATEHTKSDVKTENNVVLEVVERIVPIRSADPATEMPPPPALPALEPGATGRNDTAEDAVYELPVEPPPGI